MASERRRRVPLVEMSRFAGRNGTSNGTSRVVTRTPTIDRESYETHNARPPELIGGSIILEHRALRHSPQGVELQRRDGVMESEVDSPAQVTSPA